MTNCSPSFLDITEESLESTTSCSHDINRNNASPSRSHDPNLLQGFFYKPSSPSMSKSATIGAIMGQNNVYIKEACRCLNPELVKNTDQIEVNRGCNFQMQIKEIKEKAGIYIGKQKKYDTEVEQCLKLSWHLLEKLALKDEQIRILSQQKLNLREKLGSFEQAIKKSNENLSTAKSLILNLQKAIKCRRIQDLSKQNQQLKLQNSILRKEVQTIQKQLQQGLVKYQNAEKISEQKSINILEERTLEYGRQVDRLRAENERQAIKLNHLHRKHEYDIKRFNKTKEKQIEDERQKSHELWKKCSALQSELNSYLSSSRPSHKSSAGISRFGNTNSLNELNFSLDLSSDFEA